MKKVKWLDSERISTQEQAKEFLVGKTVDEIQGLFYEGCGFTLLFMDGSKLYIDAQSDIYGDPQLSLRISDA